MAEFADFAKDAMSEIEEALKASDKTIREVMASSEAMDEAAQ